MSNLKPRRAPHSIHSSGSHKFALKLAFLSSAHPFLPHSARRSFCRSRPSGHNASCLHQKVWAALNKPVYADTPRGSTSGRSSEPDSTVYAHNTEEVLNESSRHIPAGSEAAWYSVVEHVGFDDSAAHVEAVETSDHGPIDAIIDLMTLDGAGRQMLASSSYDTVVDVDIERGGVLDNDEDNNDFHCGVELDALIESHVLVENLRKDFGIENATHVQLAAIPRVLDRRDLVIQSHTGTGKTLAFLLPILDEIDSKGWNTQAVIVAPTRELAMQISRECDRLISGTDIRNLALIGGANPARQVEKLRKRQPHIVVGTPGRLAELHEHRELRMGGVRWLVVDEVDQCLEDAFVDHVMKLLNAIPRTQRIMTSATGDVDSVRRFAGTYLHRPVLLRVGGTQRIPKRIQHYCCVIPARMKIGLVKKLMNTAPMPKRAIAFVDDPRRVDIVVDKLYRMGVVAAGLRGNAYKLEREEVLTAFRKGRVNILVTTEVAARGLDVPEITHVFNLDLPTDGDHYLHRAGRCGRAGEDGFVVSITSPDTAFVVTKLAAELGIEIPCMEPRHGTYSQAVNRTTNRELKVDRRSGSNSVQLEVGQKRRDVNVKRPLAGETDRNMDDSLASLQDALERDDANFIEKSFLRKAEECVIHEEKDVDGIRTASKKKKKEGKLNAKTRAKAKGKAKSAEAQAKRKAKKATEGDVGGRESKDTNTVVSRSERREYRRRQGDISHRAASEGWVGNRAAVEEEECTKEGYTNHGNYSGPD